MTIFKIKRKQQTIKFGHEEISRRELWHSCPFHWYPLLLVNYHWLWFPVTWSFHFYIVVVWCEACKKRYLKVFLACPLLIICDIIYGYSLAICYLGYQWFQASSSCISFLTVNLKLRWNKLERNKLEDVVLKYLSVWMKVFRLYLQCLVLASQTGEDSSGPGW